MGKTIEREGVKFGSQTDVDNHKSSDGRPCLKCGGDGGFRTHKPLGKIQVGRAFTFSRPVCRSEGEGKSLLCKSTTVRNIPLHRTNYLDKEGTSWASDTNLKLEQ